MIGNHSQHTPRQQKMEVSKAYSKVPFNVSMQLRHEHQVKGVCSQCGDQKSDYARTLSIVVIPFWK